MRPLRIRLTTLLGLVAILTINDFPLIQNPQSKITYSQALAQTPPEWKAQADQLLRQGNEQSQTSQFEVAKQAWQQALTLYPEIGDRVGEEQTLNNLGGALLQSGNLPAAKETLRDRSPIASPTIERIKQTAKAHQAALVQYSIIYDDSQVQGKQQTQASELFIWVVQPTGEVGFRRVDLKPLWQQQNTSLTNLVASTRESIGLTSGGTSVVPNLEKHQYAP
jgi:tetratricopeptide (TPR) repeat protein